MIEPLPEELRHLVAAEPTAPVTSEAAQAAVRAKLAKTLGLAMAGAATASAAKVGTATASTAKAGAASAPMAGVGAAAASAAGGTAVKGALALKVLAVVVGVGTTAATVAVTRDHEPPAPVVERVPQVRATPTPAPAGTLRVEPIEEPAPVPTPVIDPAPASEPPAATRPPQTSSSPRSEAAPRAPESPRAMPPLPTQSQLLADATRALSLGDAARALALIEQDARRHPDGALAEEREALRISALSALGRTDEARAAARRLLATYPSSMHRPLAERVLANETP